jgi:hypothetical protein
LEKQATHSHNGTATKWFHMAESFIHKNLPDKRKEIQAYIGSLERDLEKARRDLSAKDTTHRATEKGAPKRASCHLLE